MIRIFTLDKKYTHTGKSYLIMGDGNRTSLYLWSSPEGVRLYEENTTEGREIPLTSLVDEIVRRKGEEVFSKSRENGKERGEMEWNELKEKLEKEYHFCPFCDFPSDVHDANWKLIPSIERLKSHISERHLKVSAALSVEDSKSNRYKDVKFVEEVKA